MLYLEFTIVDNLKKIIRTIGLEPFLRKHNGENGHGKEEEVGEVSVVISLGNHFVLLVVGGGKKLVVGGLKVGAVLFREMILF